MNFTWNYTIRGISTTFYPKLNWYGSDFDWIKVCIRSYGHKSLLWSLQIKLTTLPSFKTTTELIKYQCKCNDIVVVSHWILELCQTWYILSQFFKVIRQKLESIVSYCLVYSILIYESIVGIRYTYTEIEKNLHWYLLRNNFDCLFSFSRWSRQKKKRRCIGINLLENYHSQRQYRVKGVFVNDMTTKNDLNSSLFLIN